MIVSKPRPALYIVRHGVTALNRENSGDSVDRIRAWSNVPLTDAGREDAEAAAKALARFGVKSVLSSDLDRTVETAKIICQKLGTPLSKTEAFRPWHVGCYTGKPTKEILPVLKEYVTKKHQEKLPEGESFHDYNSRFLSGLAKVRQEVEETGQPVAIVTHFRGMKTAMAWIAAGGKDDVIHVGEFLKDNAPPGAIYQMTPSKDRWTGRMVYFGLKSRV